MSASPTVTEAQVLNALRAVQDPDLRRDIVSLGFIKDLRVSDGNIRFQIELTTPACPVKDQMKAQAEAAVRALPGVAELEIEAHAPELPASRSQIILLDTCTYPFPPPVLGPHFSM